VHNHTRPYSIFLWVELIGFDNQLPDFGVDAYLRNAGFVPDAVSLFVFNPDFVHTHDGPLDDRPLPFDCDSYGGHPNGYERERQQWTRAQLLGLVRELRGRGVAVFVSVFDKFVSAPWIGGHPEILNVLADGSRARSLSPFKHLSDGTLYEDFFVRQLSAVLRDYDFDGFHQADGFCHPRYPLYTADYSSDMAGQFVAHSGVDLPDGLGVEDGDDADVVTRRAAWIWRNARGEWIRFHADRMVQFCRKVCQAVHREGKQVVLNNALTRDPFQALYRHGVDYQRIAAAGVDGFVVETVAPGVILGGESGMEADPHHDFQAMLLLMAAAVPRHRLWCLNSVHDSNEQWDVLLHGPTLLEREIYCETSLFHREGDGTLQRCVAGPLVCLADGIRPHEWQWLRTWWDLGYGAQPRRIVGATLVWSDAAHANQLDDYLATRRFSIHKLLYELMARGAPLHAVTDAGSAAAAAGPLVILNPHLFPRHEIEAILFSRHGPAILVGELPEFLPEPTLRFADCHEPNALACAIYGELPGWEVAIEDEPERIPLDLMDLPEPPVYFRELYFRKVSNSFLNACADLIARLSGQVRVNTGTEAISVRALDMGPGQMRLLVGNDSHHYVVTELDLRRTVKHVRVATKFPRKELPVVDTRICGLRVPGKGMVILDVEVAEET